MTWTVTYCTTNSTLPVKCFADEDEAIDFAHELLAHQEDEEETDQHPDVEKVWLKMERDDEAEFQHVGIATHDDDGTLIDWEVLDEEDEDD